MSDETGWYEQGEVPVEGRRYEFEDFAGGRFTATFRRYRSFGTRSGLDGEALIADPDEPAGPFLRLDFEDRQAFETNLPIRFRDAE